MSDLSSSGWVNRRWSICVAVESFMVVQVRTWRAGPKQPAPQTTLPTGVYRKVQYCIYLYRQTTFQIAAFAECPPKMSDILHPPLRISPASSTTISPNIQHAYLDAFLSNYADRMATKGGDTTITTQLHKLKASLADKPRHKHADEKRDHKK